MKKLLLITIFSVLSVLIWQPANGQTYTVLPFEGPASLWSASTRAGHGAAWDFNLTASADADFNAPLYAMLDGVVVDPPEAHPDCGESVDIWAEDYDVRIHYCHLVLGSGMLIGQSVSAGNPIGRIDNTGRSDGHHLHLHIYNVDENNNILSSVNLESLPIFGNIAYWITGPGPGGGGTGGEPVDPGVESEIGDLKLEVNWPKVPGMDKTLNELVEGAVAISISDLIKFIYGFSLWTSGIIAFLTLIYVGYMYIFSGANPGMRQKAKRRAMGVVSGIAILLLAVIILNTINPDLSTISTTITGLNEDLDIAAGPGADFEIDDEPTPLPLPAPSITLTANGDQNSTVIDPDVNNQVTLAWSVSTTTGTNCTAISQKLSGCGVDTSCVDNIWSGDKELTGEDNFTITESHSFILNCDSTGGQNDQASVIVAVIPGGGGTGPTPSVKLTLVNDDCTNIVVTDGEISETNLFPRDCLLDNPIFSIAWESQNATSCTASGSGFPGIPIPPIETSGAINFDIRFLPGSGEQKNATWTLICTNTNGTSPAATIIIHANLF